MNREMVESFLAIVRLQSVSEAANSLYVSQSTVSHRLQMLESELNTKLFYRQRGFKRITLTESGKNFIPLATQWLELDKTIHQSLSVSPSGKLVIGSMDSINQYLLNNIIRQIKFDDPKLNLEFVSYHSPEIYSRLLSGQMDIGFAFYPVHYEIDAIPVFSEPLYMICPVGSIYPKGSIHPFQLKKGNQILFRWNPQILSWNHEWWSEAEPPYVKVDSTALLTIFMTEPYHWAVCPASVAEVFQAQGLIEIHPFEVSAPNRICYLLKKRLPHDAVPEAVQKFIDYFYRLLPSHPWRYQEPDL